MLVMTSKPCSVRSVEYLIRPDYRKKRYLVQDKQPVAKVTFEDDTEILAISHVCGDVVAFNHRLKDDISLINEDPVGAGHLLFILPRRPLKRKELSTPQED
jgi:glycine cleavage system H lipoate-binding protein